jgi:predicted dehydrogenase
MRAAVIGLGWWGKMMVKSLAKNKKVTVTTGVDLAADRLDNFAGEYGITLTDDVEKVLKDPKIDAIIVTVPNSLHEPLTLKAAAAGKQVFCEKPLSLTVESAKRMIEACEKAGVTLGIGHERRWEPTMQELKKRLDAGAIGKPLHVETNFSHSIFETLDTNSWRHDPKEAPGAGFTGRGIHLTDFMVWLFGPATRVWAHTAGLAGGPAPVDTVSAHITFRNGMTAQLGVLTTTPFYGRFTVFGDKGWLEAREPSNTEHQEPSELAISDAKSNKEVLKHEKINTVALNIEAWADAVAGKAPYPITKEQMIANMQIFEAIVKSSEKGEAVDIA